MKLIWMNRKIENKMNLLEITKAIPVLFGQFNPILDKKITINMESLLSMIVPYFNHLSGNQNKYIYQPMILRVNEKLINGEINITKMKYVPNPKFIEVDRRVAKVFPSIPYLEKVVNLNDITKASKTENYNLDDSSYFIAINNALRNSLNYIDKIITEKPADINSYMFKIASENGKDMSPEEINDFMETFLTVKLICSVNSRILIEAYNKNSKMNSFYKWHYISFNDRYKVDINQWSYCVKTLQKYSKLVDDEKFYDLPDFNKLTDKLESKYKITVKF